MTKDPVVIADWINQIDDNAEKLNVWETEFFESVQSQFERTGSISDKQEEVLERIYANKT